MMSRFTDIVSRGGVRTYPPVLPVINWAKVAGSSAPSVLPFKYTDGSTPLPKADIVVMTWTEAEWLALDHVFVQNAITQSGSTEIFEKQWYLFSRGSPASAGASARLWGFYKLVEIKGAGGKSFKVLLFKSDAHLAHPPYIGSLEALVTTLAQEVEPSRIYSIGTAGGANSTQRLGDVAITNAAKLQLTLKVNDTVAYNGQTFSCQTWFPDTGLLAKTASGLFLSLGSIATLLELGDMLTQLHAQHKQTASFTLADLMNSALDPTNLGTAAATPMKGVPLLTTDNYYIAPGNTSYAALEMDDAVIAYAAGQQKVDYVFVRNISDPMVPAQTASGTPIPAEVREDWSSAIYSHFGLYSSFNGALTTWATIAASAS
jgi:nucleoside phosphorylase